MTFNTSADVHVHVHALALMVSVSRQMVRRAHVLLLGDSLGDLNMAKGLKAEQVLTVGFLNDKASRFFFFYPISWSSV